MTRRRLLSIPSAMIVLMANPAIAQLPEKADGELSRAKDAAERSLRQSFTNLQFEEFGPSPLQGPIYQAIAGGRMLYYAPDSGHILFATLYDRNGVNVTALAQGDHARKQISAIDPAKALALGPENAPTVIEFTDPECPYCQALERFWAAKAAEGKPVRRLIYFVAGNHEKAAAKAEHILCSPDRSAALSSIFDGTEPQHLATCASGKSKVAEDTVLFHRLATGATPTVIIGSKVVTGFQQAEFEAFLDATGSASAKPDP